MLQLQCRWGLHSSGSLRSIRWQLFIVLALTGCPQTLINNYQPMLHNNLEQPRPHDKPLSKYLATCLRCRVGTYHIKYAQSVTPSCSTYLIHHSPASTDDMYTYLKTCFISTIFLWILDTKTNSFISAPFFSTEHHSRISHIPHCANSAKPYVTLLRLILYFSSQS